MRFSLAAAVLLAAAPVTAAFAHHGWSSYNEARPITLTVPLRDVTWGNPHGTARMTWQKKQWDVVLAPVSRMEARGLTREMVSNRQRVKITGYARSDGTSEMRLERITVGTKTIEFR